MDLLNALVALANFVIVPAVAYGSQLALGALGLAAFFWSLRSGQYDDLEGASVRILDQENDDSPS